jgi:hypothetical protein
VPPSHYESFKTYLLYVLAQQTTGQSPTPTELIENSGELVDLPVAYQIAVLNFIAHEVGGTVFDNTLCAVTLPNGGGDTFDCYDVGDTSLHLPDGGTGFSDIWILADAAIPPGDSFDTYSVGAVTTLADGTGFTGNWLYL